MAELITYANQRRININREIPKGTKDNKRSYMIAYNDNINDAMKNISKVSTLKAYLYLIQNTNNYYFALSTQDISNTTGISLKSAKDAINELIDLGYLVLREKHTYDFYERPRGEELVAVEEKKKKFKTKAAKEIELTFAELAERVGEEKAKSAWVNAV